MTTQNFSKIADYIVHNSVGVLGTINDDGSPHGAAVYTCTVDARPVMYFLTKRETRKFHNLTERPEVSLTTVNPDQNSTLQVGGTAFELRNEPAIIDAVFKNIARAHTQTPEWLPPIAKLRAGTYVIVGVTLQTARLAEFQGAKIGDEHIFTSLD